MQNSIMAEYMARNRSLEIRKKETVSEKDLEKPDGFKAQIKALAAKKDLEEMKSEPDCGKMVLENIHYEVLKEKSNAGPQLEFSIRRARERRKERKDQMKKILLKKKKMEIYYEKRALHREAYTEFLEKGKRYVGPCPAAEFFALGQVGGGNIIF